MRRLTFQTICLGLAGLTLVLAAEGCKRQRKPKVEPVEEESGGLLSMVQVADPRAAVQLLSGFHAVEDNAWRWTTSKFSVSLRPPAGAAQKGATLDLKLSIPEVSIKRLKSMTVSAVVNGYAVQPETYTKAGEYTYSRAVPGSALIGDAVTVQFSVDKFLPPSPQDQRELALVVTAIGFESK